MCFNRLAVMGGQHSRFDDICNEGGMTDKSWRSMLQSRRWLPMP
jgi:hypothetical protein